MGVSRGLIAATLATSCGVASAGYGVQDLVVGETAPDDTLLFYADTVTRESAEAPIVAIGDVRAFFGTQSLTAERVSYDVTNDIVTASGNVTIYDDGGQTYFADDVELTGDLKDGIATNFGAMVGPQGRLVAGSVVRRSDGRNTLENAAFTGCPVCDEEGNDKTPTWAVKALRVTQDGTTGTIRFRHATIEAFGVPVLYTPYFEVADPSVERKTGFLTPSIGTSTRNGLEIEVPYYFAISDYQDATLSPRYFSELGTVYKGEYRARGPASSLTVQAGIIDPKGVVRDTRSDLILLKNDDVAGQVPPAFRDDDIGPRWHLFAKAEKDFDNAWSARADIDVVSDKTYLRTYDVRPEDDLEDAISLIQPDRLNNELTFTRKTEDSFTEVSTFMFQSLRAEDDNDFMGDALPRIRHERQMAVPQIGGTLTLGANALFIHRPEGLDTGRAIATAEYEKTHTTKSGHQFRGFAELRADAYRYADADQGIQGCRNDGTGQYDLCREQLPREGLDESFDTARILPTIGADWRYPLIKPTTDVTYVIEPRMQVVVSPDRDFTEDVFNEDSQFFQFDTATLFDWNKSSGYDRWEEGQRANIGIYATAIYNNGLRVSGSIGQQYRREDAPYIEEDTFLGSRDTGLGETASDIVGEFAVGFGDQLDFSNRFRIDDSDGTIRRMESNLTGLFGPLYSELTYLRLEDQSLAGAGERDEFFTALASYEFNDQWSIGTFWSENLADGETLSQAVLLRYRDDCTIFSLSYRFDNFDGDQFDENRSLTFNVDIIGF